MTEHKVLVSSAAVDTDRLASLSQAEITYSTVDFIWENPSQDTAVYRIVDKTDVSNAVVVSPDLTVAASSTSSFTRKGMLPGHTYIHCLERLEHGTWVQQTTSNGPDNIVTTTITNSVSTSVGAETVQIMWDYKYDTQYSLTLFASGQSAVVARLEEEDLNFANGVHLATLTGLTKGTAYAGKIFADDGGSIATIAEFSFVTSISATLSVDNVFASYATITWIHHGAGALEKDGTSDFRVLRRNARVASASIPVGQWETAVASTPDTTNSAIVDNLQAGTMYDFKLQRLKLGGGWSDQASATVTTKTTSVSIQNVGWSSVEAAWGPIYDDAIYIVRYRPATGAGQFVDFEGTVQDKTIGVDGVQHVKIATLVDLQSNTDYIVELFVEERGQRIGIATVALGTNVTVNTTRNYPIIFAAIVLVALVALVVTKASSPK